MTALEVVELVRGVAHILLLGCSNGFLGCMKTSFQCHSRFTHLTSFAKPAVDALSDPRWMQISST